MNPAIPEDEQDSVTRCMLMAVLHKGKKDTDVMGDVPAPPSPHTFLKAMGIIDVAYTDASTCCKAFSDREVSSVALFESA